MFLDLPPWEAQGLILSVVGSGEKLISVKTVNSLDFNAFKVLD